MRVKALKRMSRNGNAVLSVRNLSKRFGPTVAFSDVDLDVERGEIVGLLGENGAGKSTLIGVLSGVLQPDGGEISLNGRRCRFEDAHAAQLGGIGAVYQHLALARHLDVAENLFLGTNRFPPECCQTAATSCSRCSSAR